MKTYKTNSYNYNKFFEVLVLWLITKYIACGRKPRKYIQVGSRTTEFTLVDCPTVDDRLNRPKKQWQVEARKKN